MMPLRSCSVNNSSRVKLPWFPECRPCAPFSSQCHRASGLRTPRASCPDTVIAGSFGPARAQKSVSAACTREKSIPPSNHGAPWYALPGYRRRFSPGSCRRRWQRGCGQMQTRVSSTDRPNFSSSASSQQPSTSSCRKHMPIYQCLYCMHAHMSTCMSVCVSVRMSVRVCMRISSQMSALVSVLSPVRLARRVVLHMSPHTSPHTAARPCLCMRLYMRLYPVSTHVFEYVSTQVSTHVSTHVYTYASVYGHNYTGHNFIGP